MFIVPFQGIARMVWIAVAYNLYYSFASPIYGTASSIMIWLLLNRRVRRRNSR